jgi:hypothetical protein
MGFLVLILLFLYFGSGTTMADGMSGWMNESGLMGGNNWRWFPILLTLLFGVAVSWLLFRKKN